MSTRRLAAILFTDMVGFTATAQENEGSALARLKEEERLVRPLFAPFGGREVKSTGDGTLVEFASALRATECAVEIQRRLHERNQASPTSPIEMRIGVHVGDVEEESGDILGDAVNVAARVVTVAEPGGITLSEQVHDQVRTKLPYRFEKLPGQALKGLRTPIGVLRIVLPWAEKDRRGDTPGPSRLAVLPLSSISSDAKDEYLADGLTEELISVLSQIQGLRVISRTSASQFKGTSKSLSQIGSELGVSTVLEGSVRRAGDQLRITVQLIDVESDEHRWAQTYDRKLDNVFAIQAEVAEKTATALRLQLVDSARVAIEKGPTSDLGAYDFYLRGLSAQRRLYEQFSDAARTETLRCFEEAIRRDPGFAQAYAQLGISLIAMVGNIGSGVEYFPRARELISRALELAPKTAEPHIARGNLALQGESDWPLAESEFRRGLELSPSFPQAHGWYSILLTTLQRFPEALKEQEAYLEVDPLAEPPRRWIFYIHHLSGDSGAESDHARESLNSFPNEAWPHVSRALAYARKGKRSAASREIDLARGATGYLGLIRTAILPRVGRDAEARTVLKEWEGGLPAKYAPMTWIAALHSALGEPEAALDWLERDLRAGDRSLWFVYQWDYFDPIREDPRFRSMLQSFHLPTTITRPTYRG